ncbi:MAG: ABC transporter substrate-binding protein [Burkholderiales bacterium]
MTAFKLRCNWLAAWMAAAILALASPAGAQEKIKLASSQRGFWDTTLFEIAEQEQGFFRKSGIDLEILWTDGGADTQQAIINGSLDIGIQTGVLGVVAAWAKGAPFAIIAAGTTGARDLWWYARPESGISSMKDAGGRTVAFSRPGSSSQLLLNDLLAAAGVSAKPVSTGGPAATLTQVMSGQVDAGWAAGVFASDLLKEGKIRRIASGNDAPGVSTQTVRVSVANLNFINNKRGLVKKFLAASQQAIDWAYSDPRALERWAALNKVSVDVARAARDEMYPRSALTMRPVGNIDLTITQAIANKRLDKRLTPEQVRELLRYVDELAK